MRQELRRLSTRVGLLEAEERALVTALVEADGTGGDLGAGVEGLLSWTRPWLERIWRVRIVLPSPRGPTARLVRWSVEPVPQLWVGRHRVWLRPGPAGYHLVCEIEGRASEVLLRPGVVSAWAAVGEAGLILAQDDRVVGYDLPTLEVRGRLVVELNVHRIAVHPESSWAALATGAQGNYRTHGDLLRLDLTTWQTRPLLDVDREVVDCELLGDGRLRFVLGWADESDNLHHEGTIVPGDAPVALGYEDLRPLSASERAAIEGGGAGMTGACSTRPGARIGIPLHHDHRLRCRSCSR